MVLYNIKHDSLSLGLTLFYITAFIMTIICRDKCSSSNMIIEKDNINNSTIEEEKKIEDTTIVSINTNNNNITTTSGINATENSPIKVAASLIQSCEKDANEFMSELKKGIPISRIKGLKEKKKILLMNHNYKLSIRAFNNNFLSSMKKTKQWDIQSIDSIVINEKNLKSFSLFFKEGRLVYKYEIVAESDSQCKYIVDGLCAIKEFEGKETAAVLGIMMNECIYE